MLVPMAEPKKTHVERKSPQISLSRLADYMAAHEFFRQPQFKDEGEAEKALCITLDAHSAVAHEAPGNATYLFKEMAATCANLTERWPAIKPPPGAVI
jgi:hypothetical protein